MPLNIGESLDRIYKLAALHQEAKVLRRPEDWQAYQGIATQFDTLREAAKQDFTETYATRVETRLKALSDQTGRPTRDLTLHGRDRFNRDALERQAHRDVRHDHDNHLARIDRDETTALEGLLSEFQARDRPMGQAKQDFAKAAVDRPAPRPTQT